MKYIAIRYINYAKNYSAVLCFATAFVPPVCNTFALFSIIYFLEEAISIQNKIAK